MNKLFIKSKIIGGITLYTCIICRERVEVFELLRLINFPKRPFNLISHFPNLIVDVLKYDCLGTKNHVYHISTNGISYTQTRNSAKYQ